MRVPKLIMAIVLALSLIFAAVASADSTTTDFENFALGDVSGQFGWSPTQAVNPTFDQGVVAPGIASGQALRVSSQVTSSGFGDWIFSRAVTPAAEDQTNKVFKAEFTFKALTEDPSAVTGSWSHLSISPDNGSGGRMSFVRLEDHPDGVRVFFSDVPNRDSNVFDTQWIATLDRTEAHTIAFDMALVPGENNDVVRISIDGQSAACGTSWENYYRYDPEQFGGGNVVPETNSLIIQARGTATSFPAEADRGFLIDNVSTTTAVNGGPKACPLPTGPAGPAGATGAAGTPGAAGATTTAMTGESAVAPRLIGNTKRTIHAPLRKGERFISARATLRDKRLPVHGRHITVDLRGKVVGTYNVFIVAKYKTKSGTIHVHRNHRSLSVMRALSEARTPR